MYLLLESGIIVLLRLLNTFLKFSPTGPPGIDHLFRCYIHLGAIFASFSTFIPGVSLILKSKVLTITVRDKQIHSTLDLVPLFLYTNNCH